VLENKISDDYLQLIEIYLRHSAIPLSLKLRLLVLTGSHFLSPVRLLLFIMIIAVVNSIVKNYIFRNKTTCKVISGT